MAFVIACLIALIAYVVSIDTDKRSISEMEADEYAERQMEADVEAMKNSL